MVNEETYNRILDGVTNNKSVYIGSITANRMTEAQQTEVSDLMLAIPNYKVYGLVFTSTDEFRIDTPSPDPIQIPKGVVDVHVDGALEILMYEYRRSDAIEITVEIDEEGNETEIETDIVIDVEVFNHQDQTLDVSGNNQSYTMPAQSRYKFSYTRGRWSVEIVE